MDNNNNLWKKFELDNPGSKSAQKIFSKNGWHSFDSQYLQGNLNRYGERGGKGALIWGYDGRIYILKLIQY